MAQSQPGSCHIISCVLPNRQLSCVLPAPALTQWDPAPVQGCLYLLLMTLIIPITGWCGIPFKWHPGHVSYTDNKDVPWEDLIADPGRSRQKKCLETNTLQVLCTSPGLLLNPLKGVQSIKERVLMVCSDCSSYASERSRSIQNDGTNEMPQSLNRNLKKIITLLEFT